MDDRRIFTETEPEHAARLHGSDWRGRLYPGDRRQTKMHRWALRLRRQAHEAGEPQLTTSQMKGVLDTNGTWEVAGMTMTELERELHVRWNPRLRQYEPA